MGEPQIQTRDRVVKNESGISLLDSVNKRVAKKIGRLQQTMEHVIRGESILPSTELVVLFQHFGEGILPIIGGDVHVRNTDSASLHRFG